MTRIFEGDPAERFVLMPNALLDDVMPNVPPPAMLIVLLIFRKTRGWNKTSDMIAFSQIMEGTGIRSSATVAKYLKYLEEAGLIIVARSDDKWQSNTYALNPEFDTSTLGNEVEPTLGNEVEPTLGNEDTKDTLKNNKYMGGDILQDFQNEVATGLVKSTPPVSVSTRSAEGGDTLAEWFGDNPRQAEIDAHKKVPRMSQAELLLAALGADMPAGVRSIIGRMRDGGWQIKDGELERNVAEFLAATEFTIPSLKTQRRSWEAGVREHLGEEAFKGRLADLYLTVWIKIKPMILADEITATKPQSFTQWMYQAVNVQQIKADRPLATRSTILSRMKHAGLVRLEDIEDDVTDYVWVESGELVGELSAELVQQYGR